MARSPGSSAFRAAPYLALVLVGFTVVVASSTATPGPRSSRRERLVDLIAREDDRSRALRAELDALQVRIGTLEGRAEVREKRLGGLRDEAERLGRFAGLSAASGPGVVVELRDSTLRRSPTGDPNDLVIHEQDLQAVVNGLWGAGAEAVAINGERITSSSAVRCVGNTLLLHGSVYAPPYRIVALGDRGRLERFVNDPLVERFRIFAEEFVLGFDVRSSDSLVVPAFRGVVAANYASKAPA